MTKKKFQLIILFSVAVFLSLALSGFGDEASNNGDIISTFTSSVLLPIIVKPPKPPGVYIQSNHSYFVDNGRLYVVGEVFNNLEKPVRFVKVVVDVFDSDGTLLDTDFTYVTVDNIPAGEKGCWSETLTEPIDWDYYKLSGSYNPDGEELPRLTVLNDNGTLEADGDYRVIGQVRNDHGSRIEFVQPVITLYDDSGKVADCDFTFTNITHLDVGQTSSFEETFNDRPTHSDITSYQIMVDGNK